MLISELAQRTQLPIHTLRFYEKENLIDARFFERGPNRYRHYTEAAVERVHMIRHGQAAGFTLTEVRELLMAWDAGTLTGKAQQQYIAQKVAEITEKIKQLENIRTYLITKKTQLDTPPSSTVNV